MAKRKSSDELLKEYEQKQQTIAEAQLKLDELITDGETIESIAYMLRFDEYYFHKIYYGYFEMPIQLAEALLNLGQQQQIAN